ncbi:MAG: hypothetical protein SOR23_01315 [Candidatus Enterosoma sp.]|nr:hypothetical protein [Bacilli bacterium]MDD7181915.1 hypothetical protein [Bacilli bacterium]MDY3046869.1 hypothetical protein [Candidatus Enterosoma sp.]
MKGVKVVQDINNAIAYEGSVWDLHIHTPQCPKGSNEFSKLTVDNYIDQITSIFSEHEEVKMISFTDHNQISVEVYKKFLKKNTGIKLIIGLEADLYLEEGDDKNNYKHIIFYFDDEKFDLDTHAVIINEFLKKNKIPTLPCFLNFLITKIKVPFLISPHFIKQDKRGIEYSWDEETTTQNIDKYIDQMCCFWETSNNTNIQRAIEFLKEFDRGEKVSVISFSDSNNFSKLKNYLNNPRQYFNSLPTFNGLRLAGTDCHRITKVKKALTTDIKGKCIGKITQNKNTIFFSPELNSVVGGRGSGKSLLIDGAANYLNESLIENIFSDTQSDRIKYLKRFNVEVFDLNDEPLKEHDFHFDYYNQGYAQELFRKKSDLVSTIYFKDEFSSLDNYNNETERSELLKKITCNEQLTPSTTNITSLDKKIVKLSESKTISLWPKGKENEQLKYEDFKVLFSKITDSTIIPEKLANDPNIKKAAKEYIHAIYSAINTYNEKSILDNLMYLIPSKYKEKINAQSKEKKKKDDAIENFKKVFSSQFDKINFRVKLMNKYFELLDSDFDKCSKKESDGFNSRKFYFQRSLHFQKFNDYLIEVFNNFFDANKLKQYGIDKKNKKDLFKLIKAYCYHCNDVLLESKNENDLDNELNTLKSYKIETTNEIIFQDENGNKKDLEKVSPGTRANLLLEYIVFKKSDNPIIIDQPEDNIDNETIYNQLTKWFLALKKKRQVIVITHDANIVVNSDSENIILCNQIDDDNFIYNYGALEYKDNLDKLSKILDGGKQAIERRLLKYGE